MKNKKKLQKHFKWINERRRIHALSSFSATLGIGYKDLLVEAASHDFILSTIFTTEEILHVVTKEIDWPITVRFNSTDS